MGKTAVVFPGQGSQYPGMGESFYNRHETVRRVFDEACDVLGFDLKHLSFKGPDEELTRTDNAQPALLTVGVAFYNYFIEETGTQPDFLAGHSLGEITALTCAGVLTFADALRIARKRGELMKKAAADAGGESSMLAVLGLAFHEVEAVCRSVPPEKGVVSVANYNTETQLVISGHKAAVDEVGELCRVRGAVLKEINVGAPFHCSLLAPAAVGMREELDKYSFHAFRVPVISNVTAMPYTNHHEVPFFLVRQVTQPVQWHKSMGFFKRAGVERVVEIGPNSRLTKMIKRSDINLTAYAYDTVKGRESLS
ncbi:MAG: ACP S-malonyltransferase [bacterium]|nr:ACP S-malonyltransferase [bacterium]